MLISGITGIDLTGLPINNSGNAEVEGNLNLSGVGARITGDFSNATPNSKTILKTNVTNGVSVVHLTPDGTGSTAGVYPSSSSDLTNAPYVGLAHNTVLGGYINCSAYGSGIPTNFSIKIAGTDAMVIDTSRNIGIGTSSPEKNLSINGTSGISLMNTSVTGRKWNIKNDSNFNIGYYISDPNVVTNALTIDAGGNVLLTSGTGALGYGTGTGGTVTQLTSKSTAVTLNKPSGVIIMNNSALAAGATVTFTFNNSLLASTDRLILEAEYDNNASSYSVGCGLKVGGQAYINVKNNYTSGLSEPIRINFAIIKGANA